MKNLKKESNLQNLAQLEKQSKLEEDMRGELQNIRKNTSLTVTKIIDALNEKRNPKISNQETMVIFNQIYLFIEKSNEPMYEHNFKDKSKNGNQFNAEDELFNIYKEFNLKLIQNINDLFSKIKDSYEDVLNSFDEQYENFKIYLHWLQKLFGYLDRFHTKNKQTNLFTVSLKLLKTDFFDKQMGLFQSVIFHFFNNVRQYHLQPPKNILRLIEIFSDINLDKVTLKKNPVTNQFQFYNEIQVQNSQARKYYQENFEGPYVKETEKFYSRKCQDWLQYATSEYVSNALKVLKTEELLASEFYKQSQRAVINKIEIILIKDVAVNIIDRQGSGVSQMLQNERFAQLEEIYQLICRVQSCLPYLAKKFTEVEIIQNYYFYQYLENKGNLINEEKKEVQVPQMKQTPPEIYIDQILELMDKSDNLVKKVFHSDMELQKAEKVAFANILNKNDKSPYFLAYYCDVYFKSDKSQTDNESQKKIDQIIRVFQYIYSRDVFFKHYQRFLSIRLLGGLSKNRDSEKFLVQKFKAEAGTTSVNNIQHMLNDIALSDEFRIKTVNFEFSVNILTSGCWPIQQLSENMNPLNSMRNALKFYEEKYLAKYNGRQIGWAFSNGNGEVVLRLGKERYIFLVTTIQIISFMQFNSADVLKIRQLMQLTNISKNDLIAHLTPFLVFKVLERQRNINDEFDDDEMITINLKFAHKQKKIKLHPNMKAVAKKNDNLQLTTEQQHEIEQILKEREYQIDSYLVRLMKSRKQLKHNELVDECKKMVTAFKPEANFIKQRIESLIEREYLKRDENDWNKYSYIN